MAPSKPKRLNLAGQSGQTLIETIVAIFLLTTALAGGLALTIYALSSSATTFSQIIAANLAREGVDVIRMFRDSNWLAAGATSNPNLQGEACADISGKFCYPDAFEQNPPASGQGFTSLAAPANPSQSSSYRVAYSPASRTWDAQTTANYNLYLQADGTYTHSSNGTSTFARMIKISKNTSSPYTNQNSNWELIVKSIVAWRGKGCPDFSASQDLEALNSKCKIAVEEHFTNWKDY